MRILVLTQYFWPERFVINDLVRKLVETRDVVVTVATGKPNYPSGVIAPGYRQGGVQREVFCGSVEVIRIPMRPRGAADGLALALNYLSFAVSALIRLPWLLRRHRFDAILTYAPSPITSAVPAVLLRFVKRAHLVLWVQDLWPEAIQATGHIRNRLVLRLIGSMAGFLYRSADTVLVQSEAFVDIVHKRGARRRPVYFPNFATSGDDATPLPQNVASVFADRFSVLFAGNLGKAQSLRTIVEAARVLLSRPEIRIVVAGAGSEASAFRARVADENLSNVVLTGYLDRPLLPGLLRAADCLLITLEDNVALNATVPSKLQTYMQSGKPIVGAVNGECARLIALAGAGATVPAGDGAGLARLIVSLAEMKAGERAAMGAAAKRYSDAHFDADRCVSALVTLLRARVKRPA